MLLTCLGMMLSLVFCAFAGIMPQSAIVLLGDLDHIEIWEPIAYATHRDIGSNELTGDTA